MGRTQNASPLLWKPVQQNQFPANQQNARAVHAESFNRGSPSIRSTANSPGGSEGKMF